VIHDAIKHLVHPVSELRPYPANPRLGDVETIRRSLTVNGQYRPVVANRRTNEVLAGNHTLRAAAELGWREIAVTWVDVDEEQAARIVLVDNRSNDLATYDNAALVGLLEGLPELDGTGYSTDDLAGLTARLVDPAVALAGFKEYDESAADGVKTVTCPECKTVIPL
jgi:ParB-like chromosome segregation protein Spo0J